MCLINTPILTDIVVLESPAAATAGSRCILAFVPVILNSCIGSPICNNTEQQPVSLCLILYTIVQNLNGETLTNVIGSAKTLHVHMQILTYC